MQSGGVILSTLITNRQSMTRTGAIDVDQFVLYRLDREGDKVAWIEKPSH
jgi:hypothetical protein